MRPCGATATTATFTGRTVSASSWAASPLQPATAAAMPSRASRRARPRHLVLAGRDTTEMEGLAPAVLMTVLRVNAPLAALLMVYVSIAYISHARSYLKVLHAC